MALADGTPSTTQPTIPPKQATPPAPAQPNSGPGSAINASQSPGTQAVQGAWNATPGTGQMPGGVQTILSQLNAQYPGLLNQQMMNNLMQGNLDAGAQLNIDTQSNLDLQGLEQNFANQQANLGLQQSGLGIQQGALNRQKGLLPQLEGLTQKGFDISQRGIDLADWMNHFNAGNERTSQLGNAAASGATNTVGNTRALGNIGAVLGYENRQVGLSRDQLGLSRQREGLNYKEQQAQLADQQKALTNAAKGLGISATQLNQQLQQGIDRTGLSKQISLDQLHQAILDRQNGVFNPVGSILSQIEQGMGLTAPLGGP